MTSSLKPDATKNMMTTYEDMAKAYRDALPPEMASAVNLLAHPVAGAAAAGALGLGLASQAFGIWMGAFVGAAETAQKFYADAASGADTPRAAEPAKLKLVSSRPAAVEPAAPVVAARTTAPQTKAPAKAKVAASVEIAKPAPPRAIERPAVPDDLKAISGIGPKLETVLNGYGIWTYAQIAEFDGGEIAWLDDQLGFSGRIGRDDWAGQARALAGKSGAAS